MVDYSGMFRADPRIKRRRRFADTLQTQALRPIQAPANPYGFNPLAEALQRVTAAYGGSMASSAADQREAEQRAARGHIMSEVLRAQQATVPEGGFFQETMGQVPGMPPVGPGMRTQFKINQAIDDQGRQLNIDRSDVELAGGDAGTMALLGQQARTTGREATEAARERAAKAGLERALASGDNYLIGEYEKILFPENILARRAEIAGEQRKLEDQKNVSSFAASLKGTWAQDNDQGGLIVPVSNAELYSEAGQKRYTRVPAEEIEARARAKGRLPYSKLETQRYANLQDIALKANSNERQNIRLLGMLKDGTLQTGTLQPVVNMLKGFAADLGIEVQGLTQAQVFETVQNIRALEMRNPQMGAGLTGNTSDRDLTFLLRSVISLSKTEDANEALLIIQIAKDRRMKDIAEIEMGFISANPGKLDAYTDIKKYTETTNLFTKDEEDRLNAMLKRNAQGSGKQGTLPTVPYVVKQLRKP
jgi:hypothetical protein